jgi:hypothetical protein
MDSALLGYMLTAATGWGLGALFDRDPTEYPPRPCPKCPYPAGAVVSLLLWAMLGLHGANADLVVPAVAVGIAGGLLGGSLSGFFGGWNWRRNR